MFFLMLGLGDAAGQPAPLTRERALVDLARVWYTARLFHPRASLDVEAWDAGFIALLEELPAEPSSEAIATLVDRWMIPLGDPWTAMARPDPSPRTPATAWSPRVERSAGRVTVRLGDAQRVNGPFHPALETLKSLDLTGAEVVAFDLRPAEPTRYGAYVPAYLVDFSGVLEPLIASVPALPQLRVRAHSGYVSEAAQATGGYYSGLRYQPIAPFVKARGARDAKLVFIVNRHAAVPVSALALQAEGRAAVVSEDEELQVMHSGLPLQRLQVGQAVVSVRSGELAMQLLPAPLRANLRVEPGMDADAVVTKALADWPPRPPAPASAAPGTARASLRLDEERFPARGERLFGVLKTWWTLKQFFPYADLATRNWDTALAPALAAAERAETPAAYEDALQRMLSLADDGHVGLRRPALIAEWSRQPPLVARFIEGRLVVVRTGAPEAQGVEGVRVGGVIEAIGGKPVAELLEEYRRIGSFSGEANFRERAPRALLRVPVDEPLRLRVRNADGSTVEAALAAGAVPAAPPSNLPVVHELAGGIGYVDLTRLDVAGVDAMFERLKDSRAIVFDLRGYPRGTAWSIAPRLTDAVTPAAARFDRPVAVPSPLEPGDVRETYTFVQRLPPSDKPKYRGRTLLLIDERAISQSEHTGLFLRAANGTRFVGSPTAGANGDVTQLRIPGGYVVTFSGQSVRWPDGRQLQRVGLVPDVAVQPTLEGVRAGRDEVLEAAQALLRKELDG